MAPGLGDSARLISSPPRGAGRGAEISGLLLGFDGRQCGGVILPNKGGGPRVLLTPIHWSAGCLPSWAGDDFRKSIPMSSIGRLMPGDCWIGLGSGREHPCFFWPFSFRRERGEGLMSIAIMGHVIYVPW
jgi:hypothetical protein